MRRFFVLFVVLIAMGLVTAGCGDVIPEDEENILNVPKGFSTIQAAIDAASHGDIIVVAPGVYQENIDFKGKRVTVRSEAPKKSQTVASTIIDGSGNGRVVIFNSDETTDSILQGFTIRNGYSGTVANGGGVSINSGASAKILDNVFVGNKAPYGGAVNVANGSFAVISGNTFISNDATSRRGGGVYVHNASTAEILNNTFKYHDGANGVLHIGSTYTDESSAVISGNTIRDNHTTSGVGAIKVTAKSSATITGNQIINNTGSTDGAAGAIRVEFGSSAVISGNTILSNRGNRVGAISVSGNSEDNKCIVKIFNNTIKYNEAGTEDDTLYGTGGGIIISQHAEAVITNNQIIGNKSWNVNHGGGGIALYCFGQGIQAVIRNNTIMSNHTYRWGGGIYLRGGTGSFAEVTDNVISGNTAVGTDQSYGGGIYVRIEEAVIYDNTISNNIAEAQGGGVYVSSSSTTLYGSGETLWTPANYTGFNTYSGNSAPEGANVYFQD
jgi:nitrous oxidase accessory protein NosD